MFTGIFYVLGAWAAWGTYPVPFKSPSASKANTDPFIFQCMKSTCVFLTSWIILTWKEFTFTYWGFVGAALWVPAGLMFITAVKLTGVAFATPIANGLQVIVSFCWGAFYFQEKVKSPGLSVLAMAIMILGMTGISYSVNYEKILAKRAEKLALDINRDGADETTPLTMGGKPAPKNDEVRNMILGCICAAGVGFFGGSVNVPLKHAPATAHGIQYVISFGVGAVAVTSVLTLIYCIVRYSMGMGPPIVNLRISFIPGMIAGCLWATGNICQIYAILTFGIHGETIGFPLVQCNMMVAGCWGVFYYNEAPKLQMKILFIVSCMVLLGGVALLSIYG